MILHSAEVSVVATCYPVRYTKAVNTEGFKFPHEGLRRIAL